jgi:ribose 5-phosphate isomerase B
MADARNRRIGYKSVKQAVAIANDHAGVALKQLLLPEIVACGFTPLDLGTNQPDSVDYPDYGYVVADAVLHGRAQFGVAICGSGIGIAIAANRRAGARAALCHSGLSAALARAHNDANILCLGARLIGESEAKECLIRFLTTEFEGGRHTARVEKLG